MQPLLTASSLTVNTRFEFWPCLIDVLTSMLVILLLMHQLNSASREANVAKKRLRHFKEQFAKNLDDDMRNSVRFEDNNLNLLIVRFGAEILFDPQQSVLKSDGAKAVSKLAETLNQLRKEIPAEELYKEIQITGHTDKHGFKKAIFPQDNWDLSAARALVVLKKLNEQLRSVADGRKMSASGFADNQSISTKDEENRRIEVRITFSGKTTTVSAKR